jgi:hypothetical protein
MRISGTENSKQKNKIASLIERCDNGNVEHRVSASVSRRNDSFAFFHGKEAVDGALASGGFRSVTSSVHPTDCS